MKSGAVPTDISGLVFIFARQKPAQLTFRGTPPGIAGIFFRAKPAFSFSVDPGRLIRLATRYVIDVIALAVDITLDLAFRVWSFLC